MCLCMYGAWPSACVPLCECVCVKQESAPEAKGGCSLPAPSGFLVPIAVQSSRHLSSLRLESEGKTERRQLPE